MPPRPSVKAVLICDQIIHEHGTNKKSLIGIFQDIHSAQFPFRYPKIGVYVNLTDAQGSYVLELRLVSGADGSEIGRGQTSPVEIASPLLTVEFALQIQNLLFQTPGFYEFQVFANGELLSTRAFHVKTTQPRGGGPS
ncbi:MAG: DUF6941 family protein [Planctomycetota bacterium]